MDILDIDEALKDDSFIFLEDKTHDDVSNILQQWRNNNCTSSNNSEQAFKLNTRTFTRPKRKSAQNLEAQFSPVPNSQQNSPNVNLEIGGLVTNMQKSFLQDTSPPASICSSMEVSMNGMSGSLITSADFTNINFLQSTRGDEPLSGLFFDTEKATEDGYTLSDMIRDRKALESLTLSGEGTLIKDSNIAQIDDISLINSKTTSACSTMNNSTDSMGGSGGGCSDTFSSRTCNISEREEVSGVPKKLIERKAILNETYPSGKEQIAPNIDDDFIANTTFNLVDSSMVAVQQADEVKIVESCGLQNETFRKPLLEEQTTCPKRFNVGELVNTTFDCSQTKVQCETPENSVKHAKYYEQSTPQQNTSYTSMRHKQQFTPSIKAADVNISPIIGPPPMNRTFNETFDKSDVHSQVPTNILKERISNETFSEPIPLIRLPCTRNSDYEAEVNLAFETMELLENINPNETFNKSHLVRTPSVDAADEEAFDNLLDNIGKIELNEEQIKMKKSLDTIKKRFTYGVTDKPEAKDNSSLSSSEMASSGLSMNSSGGGDRLLSRRSRLYDDINITKTLKSSPSGSINSISFVKETEGGVVVGGELDEAHKKTDEQHCTTATESNEFTNLEEKAARNSKLEKRDRDRFKTIRIFKRQEDGSNELNVPCIDGESQHEPEYLPSTAEEEPPQPEQRPVERVSRRGNTPPVLFNNNKCEVESNQSEVESNNYATFKKPKDKVRRFGGFAGGVNSDQLNRPVISPVEKPIVEQRSLSRPRYLSGLQKFGATNKAISAGDLERSAQHTGQSADGDSFDKTQQPTVGELKSPMGTKSKSFHNLSSNFGYGAPKAALLQTGVRKSTTAGNVLTEKQVTIATLTVFDRDVTAAFALQGKVSNTTRTTSRISTAPAATNLKQLNSKAERPDETVFKTPSLVSGLRAPSAKRTGLMRPSSGYYSGGLTKGGDIVNTADLDAGRHSPTDSMSSASSRGSSTGKPFTNGISDSSLMPPPPVSAPQQPATKSTGIPKPSGLRPPSNVKRSGLPRPASIVRR